MFTFLHVLYLMVLVFILYIYITFNIEVTCYVLSKMCLHIDNLRHVV
jgi:hypothetical protein